MSTSAIILAVLAIAIAAYALARRKAAGIAAAETGKLHSMPSYHGAYGLFWAALPALLALCAWLILSPILATQDMRSLYPDDLGPQLSAFPGVADDMTRAIAEGIRRMPDAVRATVHQMPIAELSPLLAGLGVPVASAAQDWMIPAALQRIAFDDWSRLAMTIVVIGLALAGAAFALSRIRLRLTARNRVEAVIRSFLVLASTIAVLTTAGIVFSMLFEAMEFFHMVPITDFLFGTVWDPRFAAAGTNASGQFGLVPLLAGTLYIAFVAMLVAVPIGLFAAVYMAEYANNRVRSVVKPLLEVLAGIPTIVYGFFALITVGPFLRDISADINGLLTGTYGSFIQAQSILTAGLVMGIMLIPFVSSLSDDIITAVPRSLRDGSLGLGATRSETVKRVILPAALPGIVSALLLTMSRAIGETMIVVLAAGIAANITINPFEAMTTVTVKIVSQLTGDLDFTSPQSLVAFALGLTLFAITLILNVVALYIVRKYREQYD
ncbi:phosphate ABC transporter permease subunit PstC [Antarcticirhabdus aurantiaca]|uniref:Phosphate ABC transporter permease subunit PstC n=1 Tax=Antarcticirhabdus aurantiaca TaxID=2606717 RepID=A0ACD4NJ75_9HYPH|nr:phosphate ABC transporter permease subunit PstC [Antarcticirhabdus aurantiaca]WAJ26915.1 phosphate ABC transporter permease subunit PstC [Jeongeuplla avenae]